MAGEHTQSPTSTTDAVEVARGSAARMYADDRATRALGISIEEVGPGRATAADGDELTASAAERARLKRSGIYDVTVRRADGQVLAEFRGHSRTVPQRDRAGSGSSA